MKRKTLALTIATPGSVGVDLIEAFAVSLSKTKAQLNAELNQPYNGSFGADVVANPKNVAFNRSGNEYCISKLRVHAQSGTPEIKIGKNGNWIPQGHNQNYYEYLCNSNEVFVKNGSDVEIFAYLYTTNNGT